jgi:glycosyltransferase involved in cell wall biosynthesis
VPGHRERFRHLVQRCLAAADAVICPSQHSADEISALGYKKRLVVIPHGIHQESLSCNNPAPNQQAYILSIGAIEDRKGLDRFAKSWARGPRSLPWYHIGSVRNDPQQNIVKHMQSAGCTLLGMLPELERQAWLTHASPLIQPSLYEGFGYPVLEAAVAGVPIVARDIPTFREIINAEAFWVAQDADWVEAVEAAIRTGSAIAIRAKERARHFTIERMATAHRQVYGLS